MNNDKLRMRAKEQEAAWDELATGSAETVAAVLRRGVNPGVMKDGWTPLMAWADGRGRTGPVRGEALACVRVLLQASGVGAINAVRATDGRNALMIALFSKHDEVALAIAEHSGVDLSHSIEQDGKRASALDIALSTGTDGDWADDEGRAHAKILDLLSDAIEPTQEQWVLIAQRAVPHGNLRLLKKALDRSQIELESLRIPMAGGKESTSVVMAAARAGDAKMLSFLLAQGCSANARDTVGESSNGTALMKASERGDKPGYLECVKVLVAVADVEALDRQDSRAIEHAMRMCLLDHFMILMAHSDLGRSNSAGDTLLHELVARSVKKSGSRVAEEDRLKMIEALAPKVDLGARNKAGDTALDIAMRGRSWECIDALIGAMSPKGAVVAMAQVTLAMLPRAFRLIEAHALETAVSPAVKSEKSGVAMDSDAGQSGYEKRRSPRV